MIPEIWLGGEDPDDDRRPSPVPASVPTRASAPGWYVDPDNPEQERYWSGGMFTPGHRPRQPDTPTAETTTMTTVATPSGILAVLGWFLWVLAALTVIAAIVACYQLVKHGVPTDCDEFGCYETKHPFKGAGYGVLAGGLLQAIVIAAVAHLCVVVDKLRRDAVASG